MIELNKIYNEDCLKGLKEIEDNTIDLIVTSPPYNKTFFNGGKPKDKGNSIWKGYTVDYCDFDDNMPLEDYENWIAVILKECYRVLKNGGSIFFNHKPIRHKNSIYHPYRLIEKSGLQLYQEIIWNRSSSPNIRKDVLLPCTERIYWIGKGKPNFVKENLESQYRSEVWNISVKNSRHPAPFPVQIPLNCILATTKENDIVLDPFMGSGTTAIAAIKTGRKYVGFEISSDYIKMTKERIDNLDND